MSFLRARQRSITALSPHQANARYLIPNRKGGTQLFSWDVIPPQTDTQLIAITPFDVSPFLNEPPGATAATFGATGLPTGLTIGSDTGIISGTAPAAAVFSNCIITATNNFGAVASAPFVWTIVV